MNLCAATVDKEQKLLVFSLVNFLSLFDGLPTWLQPCFFVSPFYDPFFLPALGNRRTKYCEAFSDRN